MHGRGSQRRRDKKKVDRDGDRFLALPHVVLDSPAFNALSWPARSLLLELARQYLPGMNGRLLATTKVLAPRGFNSHDTVSRALTELERAGFIYRTCLGGRPARASLWAVTWLALDAPPHLFDHDARRLFPRGAYRRQSTGENEAIIPTIGAIKTHAAPMVGATTAASSDPCPDGRGSAQQSSTLTAPMAGEHIEKPSVAQRLGSVS